MPTLSRGLSKKATPAEIATREASTAASEERARLSRAEEHFAPLIQQKLDEQRASLRKNGSFKRDSGEGCKIKPSDGGFTLVATYTEDGHNYEKTAEWDWKSAKLTIGKCKTL